MRSAKHLPFQHLEAIDMPLDWPAAPWPGDPGFDRRIVLKQPRREAAQGVQRTGGRACEPRIELRGLPLAHQSGKVLRQVHGLGHRSRLRAELGELLGLRLGALGFTSEHQPRRTAWRQGLGRGLGHNGQRLAPALAAWRQPLSLAPVSAGAVISAQHINDIRLTIRSLE